MAWAGPLGAWPGTEQAHVSVRLTTVTVAPELFVRFLRLINRLKIICGEKKILFMADKSGK
jgi:hypothetical protein